jgi:hemerythrin
MTSFIEWRDDYNVGYTQIDEQHKKVIGIINAVFSLVREGGLKEDLWNAQNELLKYTVEHFNLEESVMDFVEYPEREEHKRAHKLMRERTEGIISRRFKSSDEDMAEETLILLKEWWLTHIRDADMQYKPYLGKLEKLKIE